VLRQRRLTVRWRCAASPRLSLNRPERLSRPVPSRAHHRPVHLQSPSFVTDYTDQVMLQWAKVPPDLDVTPTAIAARLVRLRAIVSEEENAVFAELGTNKPTFVTLVTLVRLNQPGGVSQRRLADEMGLTPGTVSTRVDRLVTEGLVARSPTRVTREVPS
jgi:MarR family